MTEDQIRKEAHARGRTHPVLDSVPPKKELVYLSLKEYITLKNMGFLWVFYPEATGNYKKDTTGERD